VSELSNINRETEAEGGTEGEAAGAEVASSFPSVIALCEVWNKLAERIVSCLFCQF